MNFSSIIAAGIMGLATVASSHDGFTVRFRPVAQEVAQQSRAIEVDRVLVITEQAKSFRRYTTRPSSEFRRGDQVDIYFEPRNLGTRYTDGAVRSHLTIDLQLIDSSGKVIGERKAAWKLPIAVKAPSHLPLTNVYVSLTTPTINAGPGNYVLKLRIHDDVADRFVDQEVAISIGGSGGESAVRQPDRAPETGPANSQNGSDKTASIERVSSR